MATEKEETCFCYLLTCSDGTLYCGWTKDLDNRLAMHNKGRGARYTKTRLPVKLVYAETQPNRSSAMKRERQIKRMARKRKLALIESQGNEINP